MKAPRNEIVTSASSYLRRRVKSLAIQDNWRWRIKKKDEEPVSRTVLACRFVAFDGFFGAAAAAGNSPERNEARAASHLTAILPPFDLAGRDPRESASNRHNAKAPHQVIPKNASSSCALDNSLIVFGILLLNSSFKARGYVCFSLRVANEVSVSQLCGCMRREGLVRPGK